MSDNSVYVKKYMPRGPLDDIDREEVLRYAGCGKGIPSDDTQLESLLDEVIGEVSELLSYRVCYYRSETGCESGEFRLPFETTSKDLESCLEGCNETVMFAATVGIDIDRYIARNRHISPTKALLAQAFGAERVEKLCDVFCEEIRQQAEDESRGITMRFSPGYGDLPLEVQKDFFKILNIDKLIGISLGESLLMTPSKSVTAIFGIREGSSAAADCMHKCALCDKAECAYRRV